MADVELVRVLDYILNRCDAASIEAVAAAVIRRRRDLELFGSAGLPDPAEWARKTASQLEGGAALEGIRSTVRRMAEELIRREAPELSDDQLEELLDPWMGNPTASTPDKTPNLDLLAEMVHQFVAFSTGQMDGETQTQLEAQLGSWPKRYWSAFPPVVRSLINDLLKGSLLEEEFELKLRSVLTLRGAGQKEREE
jgi:hypothetical protein